MNVLVGDFRTLKPPRPANLVASDPPYNIGHGYGPVSDRLPEAEYLSKMSDFATWSMENTAPDAHLFVVHYPDFWFRLGHPLFCEGAGWTLRQLIRWCYPSNIGHSARKWTRSSRDIA